MRELERGSGDKSRHAAPGVDVVFVGPEGEPMSEGGFTEDELLLVGLAEDVVRFEFERICRKIGEFGMTIDHNQKAPFHSFQKTALANEGRWTLD